MIFLFVTTQRDGSTLRIYSWGICCGYDILAEVGANQGNYLVVLVCRGLRGGLGSVRLQSGAFSIWR